MKYGITFLGTGAAEGIPDPFCGCGICENARKKGGKDVRTRSALRLNERVHIDFGPDTFNQALKCGVNLRELRHLLITHTHEDHFCMTELNLREMARDRSEEPLQIYLTVPAYKWALTQLNENGLALLRDRIVEFVEIDYLKQYEIDGMKVMALVGNHRGHGENEQAANYLITLRDGRTLFYAVDTGYFFEQTFELLKPRTLDLLIMECTFGSDAIEPDAEHLDVHRFIAVLERLLEQGTIHENTTVVLTHTNHHDLDHEGLTAYFAKYAPIHVEIGYDGLII